MINAIHRQMMDPIQLFRPMPHWAGTPFGAHCSTGLGYTPVPGVYPSPVEQWTTQGVCITQRARLHTARITMPSSCPSCLVGSVLAYGATSQFAFSVKALFPLEHGFESLSSHILTQFCILGYQSIYPNTVEQRTDKGLAAQCPNGRKSWIGWMMGDMRCELYELYTKKNVVILLEPP